MALKETRLFEGEIDKVATAIERLREYEPPEGYYLAFSGGKDSVTIKALADMAGVKYDAHYNLTTVDPPELVHFIKRHHPDVIIDKPEKTMWQLIVENGGPPLRQMRYCCRILKERGGEGRLVLTGIRAEESFRRAKRQLFEKSTKQKDKTYLNVIFDWTEQDVWEFIRKYNIPYCSLYDEGWKRIGCVCCPYGNQLKEAERWSRIAEGYKRSIIKAYDAKIARGGTYKHFKSGEEMFEWWIKGAGKGPYRDGVSYCDDDQTVMFE